MNKVAFYVVDVTTGEITSDGVTGEHMLGYYESGNLEVRLGVADHVTQYVDLNTGAVLDKSTLSPTINKAGNSATISPTPRPCKVSVDGGSWTTDSDGSTTINFGAPGTYRVRIRGVGFHDWDQEITVP